MRVLDLYSGTGGWSQAFLDRGHDVIRIDNDEKFASVPNTIITDAIEYSYGGQQFDIVLASPPCQKFSIARISDNWHGSKKTPLTPKTQGAMQAMYLVHKTLQIIGFVQPKAWWMENPMGAMRRLEMLEDIRRTTVTFCKYGKHYRKPTDLWGEWPATWAPHPPCSGHPRNGTAAFKRVDGTIRYLVLDIDGRPCHESASRGSKTGIQGLKDATIRGMIPYALSEQVCLACEAAGY